MKNSKKIILAGALSFISTNLIAQPNLEEFDDLKSKYKVENKKEEKLNKKIENEVYFKHLNTGIEIDLLNIFERKETGVYEHPFKNNEVIVISFSDREDKDLKHAENREVLKNYKNYEKYSYIKHEIKESFYNGSFHSHSLIMEGEMDYNFLSISSKQLEKIKNNVKDKGYKKEIENLVVKAVFYHELAHSHNHQTETLYHNILKFKNEKSKKMEYEKKLNVLGAENYADVHMFLQMAKNQKKKNEEIEKEIFFEFTEYFMKEFRKIKNKKNNFDTHLTYPTLYVANEFIKKNWEIIEHFNENDFEKIAASITNGTLNNVKINSKINNKEGQKEIYKKGINEKKLDKVSIDINNRLDEMIEFKFNNQGEKEIIFNYEPNAHKTVKKKI